MGVFTLMYETEIAPIIDNAINDALANEVKSVALNIIKSSADERIYQSYTPKFLSRRGSFLVDNGYSADAIGNTLTITATSQLQNLYGGSHKEDLGDVIAIGLENFNMPFPRPWMEEGIELHLSELENALAYGMKRQGF